MQVLIWLENAVRAFDLAPRQLERVKAGHPRHDFVVAGSQEEFLRLLPSAEVALVWRFHAEWYARAPKLSLVATPSAGRELVEPDPNGRARVSFGSFQGKIMAESLLGMMYFVARRLDLCVSQQREQSWERNSFSATRRLAGQNALVVGYGALGRECARLLQAVGLRVIGVKRAPSENVGSAEAVYPVSELPRLLPSADHVVLTLPGGVQTTHLLDERALSLLRPTACLYNLGRGNAVDGAALVRALVAGRLGHAFLDVFESEPLPKGSPLWTTPRLFVMPHASAISADYLDLWLSELEPELG